MPYAGLCISGSGQYTEAGLATLLEHLRLVHPPLQHLILFDMRQEPHMFVDGHAVGLYEPADMFHAVDADVWRNASGLQVWMYRTGTTIVLHTKNAQMMIKSQHGVRTLQPFSDPANGPHTVVSEAQACAAVCARYACA